MIILVFNCGSSSLNFKVFNFFPDHYLTLYWGKAHRVGVQGMQSSFIEYHTPQGEKSSTLLIPDHRTAAILILEYLQTKGVRVDLIGHRFVHGGTWFQRSIMLNKDVLPGLMTCLPLASIHNPNSMSVIQVCTENLAGTPQYITFDTAFHASLSPLAYTYPLPATIVRQFGYRKFGFHGLSYSFVVHQLENYFNKSLKSLKIVACHLGTGGSSVTAMSGGVSVETSMGYSPLAGLMMSTRTGDLDPILPLFLMETQRTTIQEMDELLNKKSGLLGVSGFSSDIRDIQYQMVHEDSPQAKLAYDMYIHRLRKQIGAYGVILGGLDLLVFTDDIGAKNSAVRCSTCKGMDWLGIELDRDKNEKDVSSSVKIVSKETSKVTIVAMPTDEELVIGLEGKRLLQEDSYADL